MEQIRKITKIFQNLEKSVRAGTRNTLFFLFGLIRGIFEFLKIILWITNHFQLIQPKRKSLDLLSNAPLILIYPPHFEDIQLENMNLIAEG